MKRRFRGLRTPPAPRYDAVIVGAGIGGLLCGTLLARAGLRVLLVEQHYMVGGYCSTFRRAGFTFDAATHFYPILGNPETRVGKLIRELGVDVDWVPMDPVDTFHFPDGTSFAVPASYDDYRALLDQTFPASRQALAGFFDEVDALYLHGVMAYFKGRETARFRDARERTLWQELVDRFDDPKLRLLLTADCPHWGSPPDRIAFVFDSMLRKTYFLGNYYPKGSSQRFADELARVFEQAGGELMTSTRARRIAVSDDRVRGVDLETQRGRLRGRHRVAADLVISNADWGATFGELLADVSSVAAERRRGDRLALSHPCYLVHIGLAGADPDALAAAQGYYWADWNPNQLAHDALRFKIFVPTAYDPGLAGGPNRQIVILQKVMAVDDGTLAHREAFKAEVQARGLAHLEEQLPGIGRHVITATTATAQTSRRFTWNRGGAMLGWEMSPSQVGAGRPSTRGPLDGLHLVGHWVQPGGGIVPVMESAVQVADDVIADSATPTR